MSKIAGEINAEMLKNNKVIHDKRRILFAEMVKQTGTHQSVLDCLLQEIESLRQQLYKAEDDAGTAWAQCHRLALELECLILDVEDNAIVSKWWDSALEALCDYQGLKPGADEQSEAWAKMRKAGI
jgi:hypothetical protein